MSEPDFMWGNDRDYRPDPCDQCGEEEPPGPRGHSSYSFFDTGTHQPRWFCSYSCFMTYYRNEEENDE